MVFCVSAQVLTSQPYFLYQFTGDIQEHSGMEAYLPCGHTNMHINSKASNTITNKCSLLCWGHRAQPSSYQSSSKQQTLSYYHPIDKEHLNLLHGGSAKA